MVNGYLSEKMVSLPQNFLHLRSFHNSLGETFMKNYLKNSIIFADGLDHPECVALYPDGSVWAGGEGGQIYKISNDGTQVNEVASANTSKASPRSLFRSECSSICLSISEKDIAPLKSFSLLTAFRYLCLSTNSIFQT